jgi:hypothetical protein
MWISEIMLEMVIHGKLYWQFFNVKGKNLADGFCEYALIRRDYHPHANKCKNPWT